MSHLGQQKLLSYQYLPISDITLHTQQQLQHLKHKSILDNHVLQYNTRIHEFIHQKAIQTNDTQTNKAKTQQQDKNQRQQFRKWAKQVDKICANHVKLNQIQKLQLYNNAILKLISSQAQLVLVLSKLLSLPPKQRKLLLQKCTLQ